MDAYVLGEYEFLKEYASKCTDKYTDDGISMRVVATSEGQKMRGMWDPNYTTVHFAPDKDSLKKLFYTGMFCCCYHPRTGYEGRLCFHRCLFVNTRRGGGGVPCLHPIVLPTTGPMSFPGGPRSFPEGYHSCR